jgi:3-oxoadipate enol-lactonase
MPFCETPHGALFYTVTDASAPWQATHRETIVFCHGVATNADLWAAWLPTLVHRYRIVRFDTRGFGRSALPPKGFEWTLAGLGDDILAIANETGTEGFHLVGESAGGTACLALAAREGDGGRVQSLTMLSTGHVGG